MRPAQRAANLEAGRLHDEIERLREVCDTAEAYVEHLRKDKGHGDCRVQTGPGSYQCGIRLAYEAARVVAGLSGRTESLR